MPLVLLAIFVLGSLPTLVPDPCSSLRKLIASTYDYRPSKLSEKELGAKSAAMDEVWNTVKANPDVLVPCLRKELERPGADVMFRFDCSTLLVQLDPSEASRALQVAAYTDVALEDVNPRQWIGVLSQCGFEGLDVSAAAEKWLVWPKASYRIPEHGLQEYKGEDGAFFLLASMDEAQATPALIRIVEEVDHPGRASAIRILTHQATPEALRALRALDTAGLAAPQVASVRLLCTGPRLLQPSAHPSLSRDDVLRDLTAILREGATSVSREVDHVTENSGDVLAVLTPGDLPQLRRARRRVALIGNFHAIEAYERLTDIVMAMAWAPEPAK